MAIYLSNETRRDSFSDYVGIRAYEANTLDSRARIARGKGMDMLLDSWWLPMPQRLARVNEQNFAQGETSLAYTLQKLGRKGGARPDVYLGDEATAMLGESIEYMGGGGLVGTGMGTVLANLAENFISTQTGIMDSARSQFSSLTDQPMVGMSNTELKYSGPTNRIYTLDYRFVARDEEDVYGDNGILSAVSQLEAYSYPISRFTQSNRDLIGTPPVFTLSHGLVNGGDGSLTEVENNEGQAPLAYLGQPKLLVLELVQAEHFSNSVIVDPGGFTYPFVTDVTIRFREMEPLCRYAQGGQDAGVAYGRISAPKLMTRSEVYTWDDDDGLI